MHQHKPRGGGGWERPLSCRDDSGNDDDEKSTYKRAVPNSLRRSGRASNREAGRLGKASSCGDGDDNEGNDEKLTSPHARCSEDGLLASSRRRQSLRAENAAAELVVAKTLGFHLNRAGYSWLGGGGGVGP